MRATCCYIFGKRCVCKTGDHAQAQRRLQILWTYVRVTRVTQTNRVGRQQVRQRLARLLHVRDVRLHEVLGELSHAVYQVWASAMRCVLDMLVVQEDLLILKTITPHALVQGKIGTVGLTL